MKNVRENQLKKCIFLESEEFTDIIHEVLSPDVYVNFTIEGLDICTDDNVVDTDELHKALASYFDVKEVTSIHIDDCDFIGVWIVYKD
jgi:hypothetical protein